MGDFTKMLDKRWKEFEGLRKPDILTTRDPLKAKIASVEKATKEYSLALGEVDVMVDMVMDAANSRKGLDISAAPTALKGFVNKQKAASSKSPKAAAQDLLKAVTKDTKPAIYRASKMYIAAIDSIEAAVELELKTLATVVKDAGKEHTREKAFENANANALASVKKAVAKALTEIQKCRANPTLKGWHALLESGATRDLALAVQSLERAQKAGGFDQLPSATGFRHQTDLYNKGFKLAEFKGEASDDMVPPRLKSFSQIVKWVGDSFAPYWK